MPNLEVKKDLKVNSSYETIDVIIFLNFMKYF